MQSKFFGALFRTLTLVSVLALTWPEHVGADGPRVFLPTIFSQGGRIARRVNVPYFEGPVRFEQAAIFWFGRVTPTENYVDVRIGYNSQELWINVQVFDRRLWCDTTPPIVDLTAWDALTLFLDTSGNTAFSPRWSSYQLIAQPNWETLAAHQATYRGTGSGWASAAVPFTTESGWRGAGFNRDVDSRGWMATVHVPFSSLGLSAPPPLGTTWALGMQLHDRDDGMGTPIPKQSWPPVLSDDNPASWGQIHFGLPAYSSQAGPPCETITIRHRLNGAVVKDASVGGHTVCGYCCASLWTDWGNRNEGYYSADRSQFNIQNQGDVADWPCFSKYYVTFPLDVIPAHKAIISATLTLHEFGNAGESDKDRPPQPSLIQVLTVAEDWNDTTITWNNAPLACENVSQAWVNPVSQFPGWPGVAYSWDVSRAVAQAYASGQPLRLALYSADWAGNSGKYFSTSDTEDWNQVARPTLRVTWGEP